MPSHEEHCQESLRRYGKRFSELHRWMDEPSAIMGRSHRMHRHDPYRTPKEALERFGHMADHACLDHIRLDHQIKTQLIKIFGGKTYYWLITAVLGVTIFIVGLALSYTPMPATPTTVLSYKEVTELSNKTINAITARSFGYLATAFGFILLIVAPFLPRRKVVKRVEASLTHEDTDLVLCPHCNSPIDFEEQEACLTCGLALVALASLYDEGYRW